MWRVLLLQCVLLVSSVLALSHKGNETSGGTSTFQWSPRSLGRIIAHCLGGSEVWECLGSESERLLDVATTDNNTWQISEYLSIEPLDGFRSQERRRMDTGLAGKLLELVQGRALRLQLPRQLTISNAIDDFGSELGLDQGTYASVDDKVDKFLGGFGSFDVHATTFDKDKDKDKDKKKKKKKKSKKKKKPKKKKKSKKKKKKDKNKNKNKNCSKKTGRKKKDKDKHMAMMGGMIMMATLAQMFLGKVILIAGSAFIMAKIALVISLLGSLKKGSTGHSGSNGGGGTEHVVVHSSHESGWHRSMPTHDYASSQLEQMEEPPLGNQMEFYQAYQMEPLKRRLHQAENTVQQARPEATKPTRGFL